MEDKEPAKAQSLPETELSSGNQPTDASPSPQPSAPAPSGPGRFGRLKQLAGFHNIYFVIFLLLIVVAVVAIFISVRISQNDSKSKTSSLTDQQLAELKGSTTVVGDSQQILDIQSSAIFEGQVLLRNNLEVAGSLKVGGPLSLPSVTVGGNTTLGKVAVNGDISVAGSTTLQRGLTVAGPVSFASSLSVGSLKISSLQVAGDLQVNRHIDVSGGIPSKSNGSALGSGGTVSISGGDTAGTISIHTGGSPPAGCFGSFSFARPFNSTPHVVVSPSSSAGASLNYYTTRTSTSFSLCTTNAPTGSSNYSFDYVVID